MDRDQLFSQFKLITGCKNNTEIGQYLEACDFDLPIAVDLFFAKDVAPKESSSKANGFRNRNCAMSGDSGTHLKSADVCMVSDDEDDIAILNGSNKNSSLTAPQKSKPSRVLTRNAQSSNGLSENGVTYANADDVRAPIPSTRGPIVYHTYSQQYGATNGQPHSVFNQDVLDFRQESVNQARALRRAQNGLTARMEPEILQPVGRVLHDNQILGQPNSLQSLFRPPVDIMFVGNWEAAKAVSTKEGKWLLVNIQDVQEFSCQTLNRDVLANSGVKELIRTNFIFWQILHNAVDGERLRNYYNIQSFPAMFIVDPRTGELVTYITLKRQDAVTFCDQLTTFLDQFPDFTSRDMALAGDTGPNLDDMPQGFASEPECSRSISGYTSMDASSSSVHRKRKQFGCENQESKRGRIEDMPDVDEMLNKNTKTLSVVDKDEWIKKVSPSGNICRLRLKFPDGGRIDDLEITDESKLEVLELYISGQGLSPHEHSFILSFPRREFSVEHTDRSLRELGFARNELVHVELK